jgi:hypothetical protein
MLDADGVITLGQDGAVSMYLPPKTRRQRLRRFGRRLPLTAALLLLLWVPLGGFCWLTVGRDFAIILSAGGMLLALTTMALAAVARGEAERRITFDKHSVHEEVCGKVTAHPWTWVKSVDEVGDMLFISFASQLRSGRLAPAHAETSTFVVEKSEAGARLQELFKANSEGGPSPHRLK